MPISENKKKNVIALKKARSHIDKILEMIEDDAKCLDTLQQIKAVVGILKGVQKNTIECHLEECFQNKGLKDKDEQRAMIQSISEVVNLYNK